MKNIDYKTICTKGRSARLVFLFDRDGAHSCGPKAQKVKKINIAFVLKFSSNPGKANLGSSKAGTYIQKMSYYHLQILSSSQSYQFASSHPTCPYLQIFFVYIFFSQTHLFATHLYHILYTQTLFHSKTYMDAFTRRRILHSSFFTNIFTNSSFLHAEAATHWRFFTHRFFHKNAFTLKPFLHRKSFTHRRFYTVVFTHQNLQYAASFTHRYFHTQAVLYTARFFWSHTLLTAACFLRMLGIRATGQECTYYLRRMRHHCGPWMRGMPFAMIFCAPWGESSCSTRCARMSSSHDTKNYYVEEKYLVTRVRSTKIAFCLHATTNIYETYTDTECINSNCWEVAPYLPPKSTVDISFCHANTTQAYHPVTKTKLC